MSALASKVCKWSDLCQKELTILFSVLRAFASVGLELNCSAEVNPDEVFIQVQADSKFAVPGSQSCCIGALRGTRGTRAVFAFGSTGQPIAADLTPSAELIAYHKGAKGLQVLPAVGPV